MNKDTSFRLLVLLAVALLGYIVWMNTRELVELELQVDRLQGGLSAPTDASPVPAAEGTFGASPISGSFEDTLRG